MRVGRTVAGALGAVLVVAGGVGSGTDEPSRSEALAEFASDVAVPRYELLATTADGMVDAIEGVCADPSEQHVTLAIVTVEDARRGWLSMQAMWTGPAMERRSSAVIDWPVNVDDVEGLIERSAVGEITPDVVGNTVGADTRGLSALRWVLSTQDAVVRLGDDRWCDYLISAAGVVAEEADLLAADWTDSWEGGPAFVEVLADEGSVDEWLGMFVNDNINLANQLTRPPEDRRDEPIDVSADRTAQLEGLAEFAAAIGPLLGEDSSGRLDDEIDAARVAYAEGDIEAGRQRAGDVEATLATEVASRLGVTIGFSDADGDSAG